LHYFIAQSENDYSCTMHFTVVERYRKYFISCFEKY